MMNNEPARVSSEQENTGKKKDIWKKAWSVLSSHWGWKLGSLALAICLWGGLITQDTSLPRDKIIDNVRVSVVNATALRQNGMIVVEGLEDVDTVRIRASVPQRNYTAASASNYSARLDLSQIQTTGVQTLKITASAGNASQYGTVAEVYDADVTVAVEEYSTLSGVPVEVRFQGEVPEGYWGGTLTRSAESVDISGPASVVENAARCVVVYDQSALSPDRSPNAVNLPFFFEDAAGNQLSAANLTVTPHGQTNAIQRITLSQEVYYLAQVNVAADALVTGEPAEGYAVSSVRVTPQSVTLAGSKMAIEPYLAEGAALYPYEQVDISGQSRTVSQLLYLNTPGNVDYISNTAVQVVVSILPEEFVNMASGTEQNP